MNRNLTPAQQAASDARRRTFRELAARIGRMTPEARDAMAARLPGVATVEGRALSVFNACMVAAQFPSATIVGGFRQWIKAGRAVRKGEHGFAIWCPILSKRADDAGEAPENAGEERQRFVLGTVFDVTQTQELQHEVTASATPEVAQMIDPQGTLQRAGLLTVQTAEQQGFRIGGWINK